MQYNDYQIIRYTPDYHDALLELLSLLWGTDRQGNAVYLKWKYEQNPYANRHWIYLALYEGKPVGVRGNLAMRWQIGNPIQYIDCLCDADAVVHPDHRRKGLLTALTQFNLQEIERSSLRYIVTLSANTNSSASNIKLGWQTLSPILPIDRDRESPNPPESSIKKMARKIPLASVAYRSVRTVFRSSVSAVPQSSESSGPFDKLDKQNTATIEKSGRLSVEDTARPRQMADLIERISMDTRMRHVRDVEYFNWRYCNPRSRYRFLFWEKESLEGYLVLQTPARPGMHPVTIVDWEAQVMSVRAELLEAAIQLGDFDILSTWGISMPQQTMELLHRAGFVFHSESLEQEIYQPEILLRPTFISVQEADWMFGGVDLRDAHNWDFRPIYSDTY